MYRNPVIPSLARRVGVSVGLGIVIAAIGSTLEAVLDRHPLFVFESLDDIIVGVIAALVVFGYEHRRYKTMLNKVRVIAAMNHHVRNALQAISYAPYTEQEKQIKLIGDSVNRIQWALREILPAEVSAPDALFAQSPKAVTATATAEAPGDKLRA
jgi:hypothetical protein